MSLNENCLLLIVFKEIREIAQNPAMQRKQAVFRRTIIVIFKDSDQDFSISGQYNS